MKLYAPEYYKKFSCTAEKCRHNCCIGWEIDIDSETVEKYSALSREKGYGREIFKSIELCGAPHFRLGKDERCPHLDGRGLCRIISELGEGYLCEICREHPRFYNNSARGKEVGIGMACEEACRIILSEDGYDVIEEIGELSGEPAEIEFDTLALRSRIYGILGDDTLSYEEKLKAVYDEFDITPQILDDGAWRTLLYSLEYLEDSHRELFSRYSSDINTPRELEKTAERALAYFIYRHCTNVFDEVEYRAAVGFCLFCERLLVSVLREVKEPGTDEIVRAARIISEELEYSEENTETIMNEIYFKAVF